MKRFSLIFSAVMLCVIAAMAEAKYVFYFIGDGMGMGHVNTTEMYNRTVLQSADPLLMMTFPVASQARTYSANSPVTDSAAAGTALSTGHKTRNGMIGENADSVAVESIARNFQRAGYAIGVASTVAGDDATPAAFYAHSHSRSDKYSIANQAITSGYDFFAAPLWRGAKDDKGNDNDWTDRMRSQGYNVVIGNENLIDSHFDSKLLLLSANPQGDHVGYTLDFPDNRLTAEQITTAGLRRLHNANPERFFLMVEGGNIDWCAHANDGATVIKEILDFQKAIRVAYDFYLQHPDETLIIVTADHDTGGMAFGRYDNEKKGRLQLVDLQRMSKDLFSDYCKTRLSQNETFTWEEMQQVLSDNFGFFSHINLSQDDIAKLRESFDLTFTRREAVDQKTLYNAFNQFAVNVFDIFNRELGIGWTSSDHTANFVPVYAIGCGADLFRGSLNNIEIPRLILRAAELNDNR